MEDEVVGIICPNAYIFISDSMTYGYYLLHCFGKQRLDQHMARKHSFRFTCIVFADENSLCHLLALKTWPLLLATTNQMGKTDKTGNLF